MNLYEIDYAIQKALESALETTVDEETGEIIENNSFEEVEQLMIERDEKIENIGAYIKNLVAEADALKVEEKSLADRRKAKENKIERLKEYLANSMLMAGQTKFESAKVALSFRRSTSVNILDLDAVPEEYRKVKTEISADKTAIGKLLKAGEQIAGTELIEKQSLQIK